MNPAPAEPGIARRELLEATALPALPTAVSDIAAAWRQAEVRQPMDADVAVVVRDVSHSLLRATLTYFVQSGLRVRDRERLVRQLRYLSHRLDMREYVRTVQLVGIETLVRHLNDEVGLRRGEQSHLRSSAERVAMIMTSAQGNDPPTQVDVLRRLQSTGFDLR